MTKIKPIFDEYGIIFEAQKILPENLKLSFLEALAELEDNNNYINKTFDKTRLHRVRGFTQPIYRADIEKISGWRFHLQFIDGQVFLKDIIKSKRHDDVIKATKSKKYRYIKESK